MVGGVVLNSAFVEDHFNKKPVEFFDAEADKQLGDKLQDVINWILTDAADSHFIQSVGGAMVVMGPLAWGYGYSMTYFCSWRPRILDAGLWTEKMCTISM